MKKKLVFGSLLLPAVIIVSLLLYFTSDYYLLKTGIYDNSYLKAYDIVKSEALIGKTPAECYDILISSNALVFDEKTEPDILNDTEKSISISWNKSITAYAKANYNVGYGTDWSDHKQRSFYLVLYFNEDMEVIYAEMLPNEKGG